MTDRQAFVAYIDELMEASTKKMPANVAAFWSDFKTKRERPKFTPNGKLLIQFFRGHEDEVFSSREIAVEMGMSARAVGGAIRKLVNDEYVEKIVTDGTNNYRILPAGIVADLDE